MDPVMILNEKKKPIWEEYKRLSQETVPSGVLTLEDAFLRGLRKGFSLGLVIGADLGIDVCLAIQAPTPLVSPTKH